MTYDDKKAFVKWLTNQTNAVKNRYFSDSEYNVIASNLNCQIGVQLDFKGFYNTVDIFNLHSIIDKPLNNNGYTHYVIYIFNGVEVFCVCTDDEYEQIERRIDNGR